MSRNPIIPVAVRACCAGVIVLAVEGCSSQAGRPEFETIKLDNKTARQLVEIDRLRRIGRFPQALSLCQTLLNEVGKGTPERADLRRKMGLIYLDDGRTDEAVTVFEELLQQWAEPGVQRVGALHHLGDAYYAQAGRRKGQFAGAAAFRQDLNAARAHQTEALELAEQVKECPKDLVGAIHHSLGLLDLQRPEYNRAIERFIKAEQLFRDLGNLASQVRSLTNLIQALLGAGQYFEAQRRCDQLMELPGASRDPSVLNTVAVARMEMGDFAEAETKFSVALTILRSDPSWIRDTNLKAELITNVAACMQEQGDFGDAEFYLTEALRELTGGRAASRTAMRIRANLGRMYMTLGRLDNAERELIAVLDMQKELIGAEHPDALLTLLDFAALAQAQGYDGEAQDHCERTLDGLRAALGAEHPNVARARLLLASTLSSRNRLLEALEQARTAMAIFDARLGRYHKESVKACMQALLIATLCRNTDVGKTAFATLYGDARPRIEQLQRKLGGDHLAVLEAKVALADVSALTPESYARALEIYQAGEAGFLKSFSDCHLALAKLRAGQGRLLVEMGQHEKAALDKAAEVSKRGLRCQAPWFEQHPSRAELLEVLGDVYEARSEQPHARNLHEEARKILLLAYGPNHPRLKKFAERHGE